MTDEAQTETKAQRRPPGPFAWISPLIEPFHVWLAVAFLVWLVYEKGFWGAWNSIDTIFLFVVSVSLCVWAYQWSKQVAIKPDWPGMAWRGWVGGIVQLSFVFLWFVVFRALGMSSYWLTSQFSGQPDYVINPCGYSQEKLSAEQWREINRFYLIPPDCDDD